MILILETTKNKYLIANITSFRNKNFKEINKEQYDFLSHNDKKSYYFKKNMCQKDFKKK